MRKSLLEPIKELELAANLLEEAANALMMGMADHASDLVRRADMPEIMTYAVRLVGRMSKEVHRHTQRPKCLPNGERDPTRMPTSTVQEAIFVRDGWRCRFCGIKVISKAARAVLIRLYPDATHWVKQEFQRHSALYAMASSLDHIVPHGRGGKNEKCNFVTACYCCQFGRGEWTIDEVQLLNPLEREPITDAWDGLVRILNVQSDNSSNPKSLHPIGLMQDRPYPSR